MPSTPALRNHDVKTYPALLRAVKATLLEGQRRIEAEKVRTYWETGYYIQQHVLQNRERAEYGGQVIIRLAEDLGVAETVLKDCRRFAQRYPGGLIRRGRAEFNWTQYRQLMVIADEKERSRLEELAAKNAWTADEIAARIKASRLEVEDADVSAESGEPARLTSNVLRLTPLVPLRGAFYTYRLIRPKVITAGNEDALVVDLGFSVDRNVEKRLLSAFSLNDIVESRPAEDAYRFSKTDRTAKDLYTYNALVLKVVDGDTLKVRIDLGFDTWVRETLRLRGIDCPEMGTKEGEAAKAYVQSLIKEADRVIIRSSRSDKYDRYLADVFLPGEDGTEVYLNNLLLEKGFAERWE